MSNKLSKEKIQTVSRKSNKPYIILFMILIIAFVIIWGDVLVTTIHFRDKLNSMVEGRDYDIEDVTITKKDKDSYYGTANTAVETTNYYFYYDSSMTKKMFVDQDTYDKYKVGDKVAAYTTDHLNYAFTKEMLLPCVEYKNNELKKCSGVIVGAAILLLGLILWIRRK